MVTAKLERNPSRVLLQQYWPLGVVFFWGKQSSGPVRIKEKQACGNAAFEHSRYARCFARCNCSNAVVVLLVLVPPLYKDHACSLCELILVYQR